MTLAAIIAVCFLSVQNAGSATTSQSPDKQPPAVMPATSSTPEGQASSSSQAPPAQAPSASTPESANQPKPAPKPHDRKKTSMSNCSSAPAAPNAPRDSTPSPCPPPKKVVRHGGSNEPGVQITGGTTAEQSVHQRSTDQLRLATEENLKKIGGRQLSPSQQEMKSQINQFMEQSKTAAAAGDLDRAHNLATKAHLLSVELIKP
jgi:hypothetical protein